MPLQLCDKYDQEAEVAATKRRNQQHRAFLQRQIETKQSRQQVLQGQEEQVSLINATISI
jgi:hypothetical protein